MHLISLSHNLIFTIFEPKCIKFLMVGINLVLCARLKKWVWKNCIEIYGNDGKYIRNQYLW